MSETSPSSLSARARHRRSVWPQWLFGIILVVAAGGGAYWYFNRASNKPVEYRTAKIARGDLIQAVTANGQLTAVKTVQVGSQISGIITEINVDFNSKVKSGDIIAKIDPSTYERGLTQAEAELANSTAAQELADYNYTRAKELFANKLISESDYRKAEVDLHQSQSVVKMRQANVERARVDLDRTVIKAPIDGVVISRNIEVGQTVAASFSTPTLFLIANDLAKLQIEAAVSEADVGGVEEKQPVNFTVEAFTRQFRGQVRQVRYAPITNQNVVTYTSIVEVDNPELKLRPGMTATASIITSEKKDVVRIPNAAFRFRPTEDLLPKIAAAPAGSGSSTNTVSAPLATSGPLAGLPIPPWQASGERRRPTDDERTKYEASLTPEQRDQYRQRMEEMRARGGGGGGGFGGAGGGGGFGGGGSAARASQDGPRTQTVYVLASEGGPGGPEKPALKPVTIKTGITDGTNTEVLEGLKEGDVIVTGIVSTEPLMPPMGGPGGGRNPFGGGGRGRF